MQKKQPIIIEFDNTTEEQEFLNWALSPEKDNSKEILRARNLIKRSKRPIAIKSDGKTLVIVNSLGKKRVVKNVSTIKSELAKKISERGIRGNAMGIHSRGKRG
ncbi:hypothetical protein M3205_11950 [Cytobacillus firmus]|uniref:hypothetical protein n=1 Tax=Cytobacillus firmus TaxID=1399 RepID=UPI00203AE9F4|nr:hypothetical protein [Cytobacillus firmus]MCM3706428.1 hypothetical protein [Cytobacillus firmus]